MKILFVTHRYPPRMGGVETHVQELATRLVERGHEVTVFSADDGSEVATESTDDGVRVRRFRSVSPSSAFYVAPQMAIAVRNADADAVHAHNYHAFPLFFAALGVKEERFIVTTHYHGASASGFRDVLLSLYQAFGRWAVQQADEFIAVSEWEQDQLREDFGVDATVIPNGVDVEQFAEADPEERERAYLLCVGRLEEYKGVQHIVRALSELPNFDLVVAGDGPYREELEIITRNEGVENRVDFLGYVDPDRIAGLYAGADIYVTLSEFEAYGMTVSEALAAGTPCVVREAGALNEWTRYGSVVGIDTITPSRISIACQTAADRDTKSINLPTWSDITEYVSEVYNE